MPALLDYGLWSVRLWLEYQNTKDSLQSQAGISLLTSIGNMNELIERYEQTVQQLAESMADNRTYEQRFQSNNVFEDIRQEQQDIHQMLQEIKARAVILRQLRHKQLTFILDHPQLPTIPLQELLPITDPPIPNSSFWLNYLQLNHRIRITLQIHSIHHFIQQWGNLHNELAFDRFKLHLHHIDQHQNSPSIRYHPHKNMYHASHLIHDKLIQSDRSVTLSLQHTIRTNNIQLYRQLFARQQITVVAQSSYGAIVGLAQIQVDDLDSNSQIRRVPICLKFGRKYHQNKHIVQERPVFYARCHLSISATPLPPQIQQLQHNYQSLLKQESLREKSGSRSPSPNRIISTGSPTRDKRDKSPKQKREMVRRMLRPDSTIPLSMYQNWEYKYQLRSTNLSAKQLVYKNVANVKQKRVELVKSEDRYYFKLWATREDPNKPATMVFTFDNKQYHVDVRPNTLFRTLELQSYKQLSKTQRRDAQLGVNTLVHLGSCNYIYARQNNRIHQSISTLQIQCGVLGTLFVRSVLRQCQIHINRPFSLLQILQKEDGFMLTYRCEQDCLKPKVRMLVVYVCSEGSQVNEMHVFGCTVVPRKVSQQTLYRQLYVGGQEFCRLSLKMIASENYKYEIESREVDKVRVVNGGSFSYSQGSNQDLVLQVVGDLPLIAELAFRDNKNRCFFMRVAIKPNYDH